MAREGFMDKNEGKETLYQQHRLYEGKILTLDVDDVQLHTGQR